MNAILPSLDQMLDRLIATPSVSSVDPSRDHGNAGVSELIAEWLQAIGFDVRLQAVQGSQAKYNVIARRGSGSDGLVFAGHTDTVPFDETGWSHNPFAATRKDDRLYGLGSCDMKSFFALILESLRHTSAHRQSRPVVVVATADEESGMAGARTLVQEGQALGRHVLIGEPTGLVPIRAHKGIFMLRIIVHGRSGHSSDPSLGHSALEGMQAVLDALCQLRSELATRYPDARFAVPVPTLNFGRIAGGDNPNRICARCELDIDLRLTPGMQLETARAVLKQRVRDALVKRSLQVEFLSLFDGVAPMDTPDDDELLQACEKQTQCRAGVVSFATEAPMFAELGMSAVVLGPGDIAQAHQPDEYLALAAVKPMLTHLQALYQAFCVAPTANA